jgi:hypothetical protein
MADAGLDESLHAGPYRPHLTLGVWNELPREIASTVLASIAVDLPPLRLSFPITGVFADTPAVFLAPTVSPQLHALHEQVHRDLESPVHSPVLYYLPGTGTLTVRSRGGSHPMHSPSE